MSDVMPLRVRGTWQGRPAYRHLRHDRPLMFHRGAYSYFCYWICNWRTHRWLFDGQNWLAVVTFITLRVILCKLTLQRAFLIQVPICVFAIASVALTLHLPKTHKSSFSANIKRIDIGGAITLVLTVFFLIFGLDRGGNISWSDNFTIGSLIAFGIFATLFIFFEMSWATEPFAPKRIMTNSSLLACYLTNFFTAAALLAQVFHISLFFQAVQGKTASEAGVGLVICIAGSMVGSLSGGLTIQYSGKYYAITIVSYFLAVVGTCIVLFFSGLISISTLGIATGKVPMFSNGIQCSLQWAIARLGLDQHRQW